MPPARTGIADYSQALAHFLKAHFYIRLNKDGDVNVYHVGNNQLHAAIYRRALEAPGIVVLHDAVLHHFALGSFSRAEYIEEFIYNYGGWTRGIAERLWAERGRSASDPVYFGYSLLKRLLERSRLVVVHNSAAARIVHQHHPGAKVVEIPHLLIPHETPHIAEIERLRAVLGPALTVGVFGYLRESKRILPLLRIFARHPEWTLLLAGTLGSSDLHRACASYLELPNVRRVDYMAASQYWTAAQAVDACMNLRYPAAGETSGVTIGMMGVGTPVILTDSEENSRYPAGACIKASSGLSEEEEIEAILEWCQQHPLYLREIGQTGKAFVHAYHAGDKVAAEFARSIAVNLDRCAD